MIVAFDKGTEGRVAYVEPVRWLKVAWLRAANPYKGLARFEPEDADLFFGRENLIGELLGQV
jgi:hypothetical protein